MLNCIHRIWLHQLSNTAASLEFAGSCVFRYRYIWECAEWVSLSSVSLQNLSVSRETEFPSDLILVIPAIFLRNPVWRKDLFMLLGSLSFPSVLPCTFIISSSLHPLGWLRTCQFTYLHYEGKRSWNKVSFSTMNSS